jgi:hypothetical protein
VILQKKTAESGHRFGGTPAALLVEPNNGPVVAKLNTKVVPTARAVAAES